MLDPFYVTPATEGDGHEQAVLAVLDAENLGHPGFSFPEGALRVAAAPNKRAP